MSDKQDYSKVFLMPSLKEISCHHADLADMDLRNLAEVEGFYNSHHGYATDTVYAGTWIALRKAFRFIIEHRSTARLADAVVGDIPVWSESLSPDEEAEACVKYLSLCIELSIHMVLDPQLCRTIGVRHELVEGLHETLTASLNKTSGGSADINDPPFWLVYTAHIQLQVFRQLQGHSATYRKDMFRFFSEARDRHRTQLRRPKIDSLAQDSDVFNEGMGNVCAGLAISVNPDERGRIEENQRKLEVLHRLLPSLGGLGAGSLTIRCAFHAMVYLDQDPHSLTFFHFYNALRVEFKHCAEWPDVEENFHQPLQRVLTGKQIQQWIDVYEAHATCHG